MIQHWKNMHNCKEKASTLVLYFVFQTLNYNLKANQGNKCTLSLCDSTIQKWTNNFIPTIIVSHTETSDGWFSLLFSRICQKIALHIFTLSKLYC